jgi:hypothetical protein
MIGVASMMTTTTDIEIATGEQQYVETFYRAQASHTIAGELLQLAMWDRGLGGETTTDADSIEAYNDYETFDPNGNPVYFEAIDDYTFAFRLTDPDFLHEDEDSVSKTTASGKRIKVWQADQQTVDDLLEAETDLRLVSIQNGQEIVLADIDIDKIQTQAMAGGGAEFGGNDLGMGSNAAVISYNLDARARLSSGNFNKSPSRQAMGFRIVR